MEMRVAYEETEGVETGEDPKVGHGAEPAGDAQHSSLDLAPVHTVRSGCIRYRHVGLHPHLCKVLLRRCQELAGTDVVRQDEVAEDADEDGEQALNDQDPSPCSCN